MQRRTLRRLLQKSFFLDLPEENDRPAKVDKINRVPGDSFGTETARTSFLRPVQRPEPTDEKISKLFKGFPPEQRFNTQILSQFKGKLNVDAEDAVNCLREVNGDLNECLRLLQERRSLNIPFGSFGLTALEMYKPETFCLVRFRVPSYDATKDERLLEAIHEITLSAAEIPLDVPKKALVDKLMSWTTEDETPIHKILAEFGMSITDVVLLPLGDYSVHGFFVLNPKKDFPNIGTAASCLCLDLRDGIHNRLRHVAERMADSLSEHVLLEQFHIGQDAHFLRQKYWFQPEYSVEEFYRFREKAMAPSFQIFETRYAVMQHPFTELVSHRNLVENEKLKVTQYRHSRHYEEYQKCARARDDTGNIMAEIVDVGPSQSSRMYSENDQLEEAIHSSKKHLGEHSLRIFDKFYRNNLY